MSALKYAIKKEWYNVIMLLLPFLVLPFIWDQLPAQLPTHWNLQGQVDGYSSRTMGSIILPLINIGTYLLLLYLPAIDPKKRIEIDQKPIPVLRTLLVVLLLALHCWIIASAMNAGIQSQGWMYLGLAAFFVVTGNYLRTIKPNYFIGIRVPWALEDTDNWRQTHRMGSYVWVGGGLLLLVLFPFFDIKTFSTIFGVVATSLALIPAIYSFYIYKQSS